MGAVVILALLFLVLPVAELYVIVQVSGQIGFWNTLGVMILVALAGSWLIRHQGAKAWRRFNEQIAMGQVPTREIADGVCIILAGALLITPGFLTDVVGLLLLFPPTRALLRGIIVRRAQRRQAEGGVRIIRATYSGPIDGAPWGPGGAAGGRGDVTDTTATEIRGELEE